MPTITTYAFIFQSKAALRDATPGNVIIIYHNPETVMETALTPARNLLQSLYGIMYKIISDIIKGWHLLKPAGVKQPADMR